jgi:Mrp family chromosome partitioning ATPase
MSTIDRAFIKAFGQEEPSSAAARPESDHTGQPSADVPDGSSGEEPAEAIAGTCCGDGGETCACSDDGTCPCSAGGNRIVDSPGPEQSTGPSEPPMEPAGEAAVEESAAGDRLAAAEDGAEPVDPGDAHPDAGQKPFRPAFQVDRLAWPSGCARLGMAARDQIEDLADALVAGGEAGQQVVAMSGCRRGDGCTTLLLCVARRLAERGLQVAVVDADLANPLLARRLGLLPDAGWEQVVTAQASVDQLIIESLQDRLAVLPLCGEIPCQGCPARGLPDPIASLDVLRRHYDLVLVDLGQFGARGVGGDGACRGVNRWIDAVVLVRDVRTTREDELEQIRHRVGAVGLVEAGIAENFVELRKSA